MRRRRPRRRSAAGRTSAPSAASSARGWETVKPAASMVESVGRLQSQPTTSRFSQFIRSWKRASAGSSARTCSRKSRRPPGRSTRRASRTARGWSSTPQSTSVETTVSKVVVLERQVLGRRPQHLGQRRLLARRRAAAGGASAARGSVSDERLEAAVVVGEVRAGAGADLEHAPARVCDEALPHVAQSGLLALARHPVVGRCEDRLAKAHAARLRRRRSPPPEAIASSFRAGRARSRRDSPPTREEASIFV